MMRQATAEAGGMAIAPQPATEPFPPSTPPIALATRWPRHEQDEIEAAVAVLASGRVNALVHGDETRAFEHEFAEFVGVDHAVAVANGTVALECALRALGIGPGDEVILPARSFFASASSVVAVGAEPVFADIEPGTQNICPRSAARMITRRTRAIICVHLAGLPCDMAALAALSEAEGLFLVEDCAQAHGAELNGQRVGSFGHAAAFSFCTDKIMSTGGEGGMVTTPVADVWRHVWAYKDHGKNPDCVAPGTAVGSGFRYVHDSFGSNFRSTELQAAIGRRQLARLPGWLEQRRANAAVLVRELDGHPAISLPVISEGALPAWYKFNLQLRLEAVPGQPGLIQIVDRLRERGVTCGVGSCPDMSREAAFGSKPPRIDGDLPNARLLGSSNLMLAVDHTLDAKAMAGIAQALLEAIN